MEVDSSVRCVQQLVFFVEFAEYGDKQTVYSRFRIDIQLYLLFYYSIF